jgi:drug/metabolite transporter (DMT)-like permease
MAVMLDLRLLGLTLVRVPISEIKRRLGPLMVAGFVAMVITGVLLFYAIPVRSYQSIFFRIKLVALVLAGLNAWVFHTTIDRHIAEWDRDPVPPRAAKRAGATSLVLWAIIVVAGRMIAYNWFDCDKQPQPAIVNALAGCIVRSR